MIGKDKIKHYILFVFLLFSSSQVMASEVESQLNIHVNYQQEDDSWKVKYELPVAVDHVAFQRSSNFDRRKLYKFDESKFKWDKVGNVLLIRSIDGSKFTSFNLTFSSHYGVIQKDYEHNIKYSDGSVLLYTNHLVLGSRKVDDKTVDHVGVLFKKTQFHFNAPKQNIVFLGQSYKEQAQWTLSGNGTYIYFGNIAPIENDNVIAIVDPNLPKWAWDKTQQYFPKLFDYYQQQTDQALSFKPVVFFNYDDIHGKGLNYHGGTLDGLVQLTIKGQRWQQPNDEQFNMLFHFLAHEAAHFWNGQMFSFEDQKHSWMHEGGADAFANFAMLEFGFIDKAQMIQRFEYAANQCLLNKGDESLEQSAKLWRYRNYYTCGATMALASHFELQEKSTNKSLFDLWKLIFEKNEKKRTYSQEDYFEALQKLAHSSDLSTALASFSHDINIDNQEAIASWFKNSDINITLSSDYPKSAIRHWGKQVISSLMKMHCKGISYSHYDDYIQTYSFNNCPSFKQEMEIKYVGEFDILQQGLEAYRFFRKQCHKKEKITFYDKSKKISAEIQCLKDVPEAPFYMRFDDQKLAKH